MKRRTFLRWSLGGSLLGAPGMVPAKAWVPNLAAVDPAATGLQPAHWHLIAAVQDHLFPSEPDAPGVREANATAWLQWVLSDPALPEARRRFFREGAERLSRLCREMEGRPFQVLDEPKREAVLRRFEADGGRSWLSELLYYILEALLTDPVYGGNPGGVGWRWLDHHPGFRRPTPERRYFLLVDK